MSDGAVLDTGFLISLVDRSRPCHATAKRYYKHFLENAIEMCLPTVVAAEFAIKQPISDLPLRNFRVLPFNLDDAERCAGLNVAYYRSQQHVGQRDAVKDDFKIIAQAEVQGARLLITEDEATLSRYCGALIADGKVRFRVVSLRADFDVSFVNENGQIEMPLDA